MDTVTIHWLGVLVAVVVAFVANFVYFGPKTMYPIWWRAMGRSESEVPGGGQSMGVIFGLTILASLVQAVAIAWVIAAAQALYKADVTPVFGAVVGLSMGAGIAAAASLGHRLFAGQGLKVWAIEAGGDLLSLTLIGLVLSFWY